MGKKICGCDLGTGFSCVAVMEAGAPKVIINSVGRSTTPSVIMMKSRLVMPPKDKQL